MALGYGAVRTCTDAMRDAHQFSQYLLLPSSREPAGGVELADCRTPCSLQEPGALNTQAGHPLGSCGFTKLFQHRVLQRTLRLAKPYVLKTRNRPTKRPGALAANTNQLWEMAL